MDHDNSNIHPMYNDILSIHTCTTDAILPFEKRDRYIVDSSLSTNDRSTDHNTESSTSAYPIYNNAYFQDRLVDRDDMYLAEHTETLRCQPSESFHSCAASNHDPLDSLHRVERRELSSSPRDSFRTGVSSYDSADLLSIDDSSGSVSFLQEESGKSSRFREDCGMIPPNIGRPGIIPGSMTW